MPPDCTSTLTSSSPAPLHLCTAPHRTTHAAMKTPQSLLVTVLLVSATALAAARDASAEGNTSAQTGDAAALTQAPDSNVAMTPIPAWVNPAAPPPAMDDPAWGSDVIAAGSGTGTGSMADGGDDIEIPSETPKASKKTPEPSPESTSEESSAPEIPTAAVWTIVVTTGFAL